MDHHRTAAQCSDQAELTGLPVQLAAVGVSVKAAVPINVVRQGGLFDERAMHFCCHRNVTVSLL